MRRKIDRIKGEIDTLLAQGPPSRREAGASRAEGLEAISCVGCRHDEITRFMEEDLELNPFLCGISVRGGLILSKDRRTRAWWATTLRLTAPTDLARRTRRVQNIHDYLQDITDLELLTKLQSLATDQDPAKPNDHGEGDHRAIEKGIRMGLITAKGSGYTLTPRGWELYVTLVHLVHNHVVKLDPERSRTISMALADRLGWVHGSLNDATPYQMSMTKKMDLLHESGILSNLIAEGLTENQVREFLYDNWHTENPIDYGSKEE